MAEEELKQQEDNTVIAGDLEGDQLKIEGEGEAEDNEIVLLAGQEEKVNDPDPTNHILKRISKRKEKLQDENDQLRSKIAQQAAQPTPIAPEPDEYDFEDRKVYLAAKAKWQQELLNTTVKQQLNNQQNGHRIAAKEQQDEVALTTYAKNAAGLKVSDFNETQDKAFDILGDDFAQMIARSLPDDGPKLMYWLGKNPVEAARYRDDFNANPGGTTFALGKLAGKLTKQPKRTKAANPESKNENSELAGDGGSDWQKRYTKLTDDTTFTNMAKSMRAIRAFKKEAKEAGFDVSTLK